MIDIDQLKALAEFMEGLTELSNRTGVTVGSNTRPDIEVANEILALDVTRDSDGVVSYAVDLDRR